eukprot:CAMPEP_0113632330 /NCGR_PEP_ID=MMETSP0017_2-20120614/16803_1 /TAXON_ID=2856 /ORGANISM="Cylindrotheca closterium" /LENGTH=514 /DNA_ID=CAMNT_0000542879 /DNA_START=55 /DNA_END=1596 /DNA_ORIENTATION=+ /assembly_acc=CAM_ASM_000147
MEEHPHEYKESLASSSHHKRRSSKRKEHRNKGDDERSERRKSHSHSKRRASSLSLSRHSSSHGEDDPSSNRRHRLSSRSAERRSRRGRMQQSPGGTKRMVSLQHSFSDMRDLQQPIDSASLQSPTQYTASTFSLSRHSSSHSESNNNNASTNPPHRRHSSSTSQRRGSRRERMQRSPSGGGGVPIRRPPSLQHSFRDLRDLRPITSSSAHQDSYSSLNPPDAAAAAGFSRSNSGPQLVDYSNERFARELPPDQLNHNWMRMIDRGTSLQPTDHLNDPGMSPRNSSFVRAEPPLLSPGQRGFSSERLVREPALLSPIPRDWASDRGGGGVLDRAYFSPPPGTSVAPMEGDERMLSLALQNEDLKVRIGMLQLQRENDTLKTRIERIEEGKPAVVVDNSTQRRRESRRQRREVSVGSSDDEESSSEYTYEKKRKNPKKTKRKQRRSSSRRRDDDDSYDYRTKRNIAIVVGLVVAVAGGITGLVLSHPSNRDNGYEPITDDAPIFDQTIFPASMKDD